jgi:hypothetical protein
MSIRNCADVIAGSAACPEGRPDRRRHRLPRPAAWSAPSPGAFPTPLEPAPRLAVAADQAAAELTAAGAHPAVIPFGGSNRDGALA